jgi:uncharacterized protein
MSNEKKEFQLLIKPAGADCNLACGYCFYRRTAAFYPEETGRPMPDDVLERMISGYLGLRFDTSVFSWQGGEPTLCGLDFFRKAVELQQTYGAAGQRVGNAFQTNAVLIDDEWARFFAEYDFLVGVSLDGPPDIHNEYRRTVVGSGSAQNVLAAVEHLKRHNVSFNILTLVTQANVQHARPVYQWLVSQGFRYLQFIPCLERDPDTDKRAVYAIKPGEYGRFLCELFDEWYENGFPNISVRLFDSVVNYYVTGVSGLCTFGSSCDAYVVIERTGDVYPCDFFVTPEWKLGNIMEREIDYFIRCGLKQKFAAHKSALCRGCSECEWKLICWGGCIKDRLFPRQDYGAPSYFCAAYRKFFEHTHTCFETIAGTLMQNRRHQRGTR